MTHLAYKTFEYYNTYPYVHGIVGPSGKLNKLGKRIQQDGGAWRLVDVRNSQAEFVELSDYLPTTLKEFDKIVTGVVIYLNDNKFHISFGVVGQEFDGQLLEVLEEFRLV